MLLTNEQKQIFIQWLEQQITSSKGISSQLSKINLPQNIIDQLTNKEKIESTACKVVLNILKSYENQEIG